MNMPSWLARSLNVFRYCCRRFGVAVHGTVFTDSSDGALRFAGRAFTMDRVVSDLQEWKTVLNKRPTKCVSPILVAHGDGFQLYSRAAGGMKDVSDAAIEVIDNTSSKLFCFGCRSIQTLESLNLSPRHELEAIGFCGDIAVMARPKRIGDLCKIVLCFVGKEFVGLERTMGSARFDDRMKACYEFGVQELRLLEIPQGNLAADQMAEQVECMRSIWLRGEL